MWEQIKEAAEDYSSEEHFRLTPEASQTCKLSIAIGTGNEHTPVMKTL